MFIDVAIPSHNGDSSIIQCLEHFAYSVKYSPFKVRTIHIDIKAMKKETRQKIKDFAYHNDFHIKMYNYSHTLPQSRDFLIRQVDTKWFLFLDDDVYISRQYMTDLHDCVAPAVGGIQGRKADSYTDSKWVKRRPQRGTLFATLLRKEAVVDIYLYDELTVLEDEYIRQHVEKKGYLWLFNHNARQEHDDQGRHTIDYTEGYLAGKYDLLTYDYVLLHPFYAMLTGRSPVCHIKRAAGFIEGYINRRVL